MGKSRKIVIIGNGGAAVSAVRAVRSVDKSSAITLIASENLFAYSPVALTYYIAEEIRREQLFLTDQSFYRNHNAQILLGVKALEIRPESSSVLIEGQRMIPYDRLLIATGSSPVLPNEFRDAGVIALRTLGDADRIRTAANRSKTGVVLGGGLLSLQVAQALWKLGLSVTVIVMSNQVLSKNVDFKTASIVQREMQERGISIRLGNRIVSSERIKNSTLITLDTGEKLSSSLVICGKGVRPNLLDGPISTDEDMIVDNRMQTRLENVYAAGDVCLGKHLVSNQWFRAANWPTACIQGEVAGLNMAGRNEWIDGCLNQNIVKLFGVSIASIGLYDRLSEKEDFEVFEWPEKGRKFYRKVVSKGGRIVGATFVNDMEDIGIIRNLIIKKAELSDALNIQPEEKFSAANLILAPFFRSG